MCHYHRHTLRRDNAMHSMHGNAHWIIVYEGDIIGIEMYSDIQDRVWFELGGHVT